MSLIEKLGIASLLFVALFTLAGCLRPDRSRGQTVRGSLFEAWQNIVVGFGVNWLANWVLLPLVGAQLTAATNFWLGCLYTCISIVRQFIIRRINEARTRRIYARIA